MGLPWAGKSTHTTGPRQGSSRLKSASFPACFEELYQAIAARPPLQTTPGTSFGQRSAAGPEKSNAGTACRPRDERVLSVSHLQRFQVSDPDRLSLGRC